MPLGGRKIHLSLDQLMETISSLEAVDPLLKYEKLMKCTVEGDLDLRLWNRSCKTFEFEHCLFKDSIIVADSPALTAGVQRNETSLGLLFTNCTFEVPLSWIGLCFQFPVMFQSCRFNRYTDFTHSAFYDFSFRYSNFDEGAYFEGVQFLLPKILVWSPALLLNQFEMVTFKGGAEFDYAHFDIPVCFARANFYESSTFRHVTFSWCDGGNGKKVCFDFRNVEIFGSVVFQRSLIGVSAPITSNDQRPENGKITDVPVEADFTFVHVHKRHGLSFHSENLQQAKFLGTNLDACYFNNVEWPRLQTHYPLNLRKLETLVRSNASNSLLKSVLWFLLWSCGIAVYLLCSASLTVLRFFSYLVIRYDTRSLSGPQQSARECSWCSYEEYGIYDHCLQQEKQEKVFDQKCQKGEQVNPEVKKWRGQWALLSRAYRDLKTAYEDNKDYIYASDFHYREKELRRINWEVPRSTRVQLYLYWLVSGYGERAMRPLGWFVLVLLLGAAIYASDGDVLLKAAASPAAAGQGLVTFMIPQPFPLEKADWGAALRYSAETMAFLKPDFLDLGQGLTFARCVAWAQAITGPSLFAMFVLALKNKLKR